jgi:hypothetical protein
MAAACKAIAGDFRFAGDTADAGEAPVWKFPAMAACHAFKGTASFPPSIITLALGEWFAPGTGGILIEKIVVMTMASLWM